MLIIDNARFGFSGIRTVIDGIWHADREKIQKIIVPEFRVKSLSFFYELFVLPFLLRKVDDIVIWPSNRVGFCLSKRLKKNSVVIVHDIQFLEFPKNYSRITRLWRYWMLKRIRQLEIRVFAISPYTKQSIFDKLEIDSTVIFPGVALRRPTNIEIGNYFLYYGSAAENKRLRLLLSNYNEYRSRGGNKRLVLVISRNYEKFIREHGQIIDPMISIHTSVPDAQLSSLIAGCWKIVNASNYEGFGLFVLEGWKFDKEVIIYNNSNLSYFNEQLGRFTYF